MIDPVGRCIIAFTCTVITVMLVFVVYCLIQMINLIIKEQNILAVGVIGGVAIIFGIFYWLDIGGPS